MKTAKWFNGLRFQMVLLLTLALFPLGAVAIYQTNRVAAEAERNAELALLAVTGRAAKAEELIIERAFGAARFFATVAGGFVDNPARCAPDLGQFVQKNDRYSFVGILPLSGRMTCTSTGESYDFSGWPNFQEAMDAQKSTIVLNTQAPLSGESVFVISEPFEIDGVFAGFISISVPHAGLPDTPDRLAELGLEELMTFNTDGTVLTARSTIADALDELPRARDLNDLIKAQSDAFQDRNQNCETRTYTIVPIEGSPATVIGVWRTSDGLGTTAGALVRPSLFPILMWFASMGVAMLSLYLLVLRHVSKLRRNFDAFTTDRSLPADAAALSMPNELMALSDNFHRMAQDIMHDEATLEDAVHDKNVLIKEVHHRVKNNLQLISSIMNMQIRSAKAAETKTVLSRLQDRVRSLATIHRDLYQSQNAGMVNVGTLVSDVIENSLEVAISGPAAIDLKTQIEPLLLYPDQAVPLSLLAAEGTTNIMKYLGASKGEKPWISATLSQDGAECVLTLANSVGETKAVESTGLGSELIEAFTIQLGGRIEINETPERYEMHVHFRAEDFVPDQRDY